MNREELKEKYGKKRVPREWRGTDSLSILVTTFFGSGMSPKAPGTMGSLAAAVVAYPMALLAVRLFGDIQFNPLFLIAAIISLQGRSFTGIIPRGGTGSKKKISQAFRPGIVVVATGLEPVTPSM